MFPRVKMIPYLPRLPVQSKSPKRKLLYLTVNWLKEKLLALLKDNLQKSDIKKNPVRRVLFYLLGYEIHIVVLKILSPETHDDASLRMQYMNNDTRFYTFIYLLTAKNELATLMKTAAINGQPKIVNQF